MQEEAASEVKAFQKLSQLSLEQECIVKVASRVSKGRRCLQKSWGRRSLPLLPRDWLALKEFAPRSRPLELLFK